MNRSRTGTVLKTFGKVLLASFVVNNQSQTTELSDNQSISCVFDFPLQEAKDVLKFAACADQNTHFDKYMTDDSAACKKVKLDLQKRKNSGNYPQTFSKQIYDLHRRIYIENKTQSRKKNYSLNI